MSFVELVTEDQADSQLRQIYDRARQAFGAVPDYLQALGRTPDVIATHLDFGERILRDGALSQAVKEQIGLVVSGINSSSYCIAIHMEILRKLGVEKALGRKLATDYARAPVDEKVQALFRFADRLTRKPVEIEKENIEELRAAGWSDAVIVEAALAVAWFNFINRVSLGLGLLAEY